MDLTDLKQLEGKNVWTVLKNNFEYNGLVEKVHDAGNGLIFIHLTDKFGKLVMFTSDEIKLLQEKK